jgi:multidrug efflux pump subunit AcrA (membrane-fusion protein)
MPGEEFTGRDDGDLKATIAALEAQAVPLREQVDKIRAEVDELRTELRRRQRLAQVEQRKAVRAELAAGHLPSLEEWVSGAVEGEGSGALDDYRFLRESATEVRLGYASSAQQSLSFTDGRATDEVGDLAAARELYARGWDFGTPQARGVRIYPTGTRAERVVPASEVHLEPRAQA